jgi:DNA-directed RNA polymerase subunit RPC12/RpoP
MKENQYKCAVCGGVFDKVWSDEEAMEEYHKEFPGVPDEDREIVCDDCWNEITAQVPPTGRRLN